MAKLDERFLFNKQDTAKAMDISVQAFDKWEVEPVEKRGREVFYYLPDVIAFRLNRDDSHDLTAERARLAKEQADKTAMENEERRGRLLDGERVADLWVKIITNAKTKLLAIPTKAAPLVIGSKTLAQAKDVLEKLIHDVLTELSAANPVTIAGSEGPAGMEAAAEADGQPVGRRGKKTQPRK